MAPLSLPARSALLILMTLREPAPNSRIREQFGFEIKKKEREELEVHGYIKVTRGPRNSNLHELTEDGWVACRDELRADAPPKAFHGYRVLYPVLNLFERHLTAVKATLADVVLASDEQSAKAALEAEEKVRSAYHASAEEPGDWVRLTQLRDKLELPRKSVDSALLRLDLAPEVELIAEVNQKELLDTDVKAAIRIGNQDKHLLRIRRS